MKRSTLKALLAILFMVTTVVCVVLFSGCTKDCRDGGDHKWIESIDWSWLGGKTVHKDPTCTEDGYTDYYCNYCFEKKREILPALGHKVVVDEEEVAPTCTSEGIAEVSHCSVCNETIGDGSAIPKTEHNAQKVGEDIEPTCTSTGVIAEMRCADCNALVSQRQVVPKSEHNAQKVGEDVEPTCTTTGIQAETRCVDCNALVSQRKVLAMVAHTPVVDIPAVQPTCKQSGMTEKSHCKYCGITISQQMIIPATEKHSYGNDSLKCVVCNDSINPNYKAITSSQDLQNISVNLSGKYYLANDINLNNANWEPIGRGYGEFVGVLDGNGFSIINLSCGVSNNSSKQTSLGGLFEKNSGVLRDITINNFSVNISYKEEKEDNSNPCNPWSDHFGDVYAQYGAFAAENKGTITNCTICGTVDIMNSRVIKKYYTYASDGKSHIDRIALYYGGIAGFNLGNVIGCVNSATFTTTAYGYIESMMGMLGGSNSGYSWNIVYSGSIGGIVGSNNASGTVSNCKVNGNMTFNSNLSANCISNHGTSGWLCQLQNSVVVGSLVGSNFGKIQGCASKKMSIKRSHMSLGVTSKVNIIDNIVNSGTNGFYGKNDGGSIGAIELLS